MEGGWDGWLIEWMVDEMDGGWDGWWKRWIVD